MSFGQMLVHTCNVYRNEDSKKGNFTKVREAERPLLTGLPCRFIRKSTTNRDEAGHVRVVTYYKLLLLPGADVRNGDIIYQTRDGIEEGRPLVAGDPYTPSGHHMSLILQYEGDV